MKKLLVALTAVLVSASAFAQGTINFNNRGLTAADGSIYNQLTLGNTAGATAQLFVVTGAAGAETYTPLTPTATYRTGAVSSSINPLIVTVPGVAPGTAGTRVVMRAWQGASYETATERGESNIITLGALGGTPAAGPPLTPPNLDGLQNFTIVPEPSTITLGLLGAAALLFRRRK